MKTRITELFEIEHPIIQGGMHYVGFAELAAAVSNAGGLGIITGLTQRTPELLAREIARCRDMTDKPFGVNLTFLPSFTAPPYPEYIAAIRDGGVKIVETAGSKAVEFWPKLKAAGISIIHKCVAVRHAVTAQRQGVDAVSIDQDDAAYHKFLKDFNVNLITVRDEAHKSSDLYGTFGWPESYIIDRQGVIRRKFIGAVDWNSPDSLNFRGNFGASAETTFFVSV